MRTITHTGATTPYNYTIETSNNYSLVFEPNTLKVTLGSGYAATQEVTIAANGITLKRNCIAWVCTFDLSVIFESYFANKNYALNYSANTADPFYKLAFNIVITALTETHNVQYTLRWGAYQFDEIKSNANYSFPFWVGMPLVVNSDKEHDRWYYTRNQTVNTNASIQTVVIDTSTAVTITHEVTLSNQSVQIITYTPKTCPNGHYLQWVDSHGRIIHYMFYANRDKQNAREIKSGETIPYYPKSIDDSVYGLGKVLEKSKQRTFGCFQSVEDTIYPIVESIVSSPIVKYWKNSRWIEVKIKDMTVEGMKRGYVDIEFTVELPKDFIQRR